MSIALSRSTVPAINIHASKDIVSPSPTVTATAEPMPIARHRSLVSTARVVFAPPTVSALIVSHAIWATRVLFRYVNLVCASAVQIPMIATTSPVAAADSAAIAWGVGPEIYPPQFKSCDSRTHWRSASHRNRMGAPDDPPCSSSGRSLPGPTLPRSGSHGEPHSVSSQSG